MSFDFKGLSLKGVKASASIGVLPPGRYVCDVTEAKIIPGKADANARRLEVKLKDVSGKGVITAWHNIHLPKSPKGQEIGLEEMRSLLERGGHADPDNIGDHGIASIKGLRVGVYIGESAGGDGVKRSEVKAYLDPTTVKGYEGSVGSGDTPAIGGGPAFLF